MTFLRRALPVLIAHEKLDLVIANAENAANGSGLTPNLYRKIREAGVDLVTLGDHIYKKAEIIATLQRTTASASPPTSRPTPPAANSSCRGARRHARSPPSACWAGRSCGRSIVPFTPPTAC